MLIAKILVGKYIDGLPLHRQAGIIAPGGVDIARATPCDGVGCAAWWLARVAEAIGLTHYGHASLVLLSHDEYQRLRRRDCVAMTTDKGPRDLRDAVAAAMPSVEAETYNSELD